MAQATVIASLLQLDHYKVEQKLWLYMQPHGHIAQPLHLVDASIGN